MWSLMSLNSAGSLIFDWKGDEAPLVKCLIAEKADAFPVRKSHWMYMLEKSHIRSLCILHLLHA